MTPARIKERYGFIFCADCHHTLQENRCQYCREGGDTVPLGPVRRCCQGGCQRPVHVCDCCIGAHRANDVLCRKCWQESGPLCIICQMLPAQQAADFGYCYCKSCYKSQGGLDCEYCHDALRRGAGTRLEPCFQIECGRQVRVCDLCVLSHHERPVSCRGCWSTAGRSCIACGETPAQYQRDFKSRCKSCLHGKDRAALAMFVEPETLAYLALEVPSQAWDGSEPALQLLVLPEAQAEPLPSYPMRPEHVAQEHCRLCLWSPTAPVVPETRPSPEILEEAARWGIAASVAAHVRSEHGMSPSEYRAAVSRRVAGHWPEPVAPATLRARVAAYKEGLSDAEFGLGVCACCAREKRRCKLFDVEFVSPTIPAAPPWLGPQVAEEWSSQRETWFRLWDGLLNVNIYLQRIFCADELVDAAVSEEEEAQLRASLGDAAEGDSISGSITDLAGELAVACAWRRRLEIWRDNLRAALRADAVAVPGRPQERWLLWFPRDRQPDAAAEGLLCTLCRKCRDALSATHVVKGSWEPKPKMPQLARANGNWRGPQPPELAALTFAEQKVVQLARLYVSVKRVFLDTPAGAHMRRGEAPLYHEKNVVAYPQNPDAVLPVLGLAPKDLPKVLVVQFVGGDRSRLRHEPSLQVDIARLRTALVWLTTNNLAWMEATKAERFEKGSLGVHLDALLSEFRQSLEGDGPAVPAELLQAATQVDAAHVPLHQHGPADAVAGEDSDEAEFGASLQPPFIKDTAGLLLGQQQEAAGAQERSPPDPDECAAVLQGGWDDITPMQLWNTVMRNYQVAERCEAAAAAAEGPSGDALAVDRNMAVADAVRALARLQHEETKQKLLEFHRRLENQQLSLHIGHSPEPLSNFDPRFWSHCFVDLFPYCDCVERMPGRRPVSIPDFRWAKMLLTRADFCGWRMSCEFVACLYNLLLRRSQLRAVHLLVVKGSGLTPEAQNALQRLEASDLMKEALASGECNSVRELLRRKNLDGCLRTAVQTMKMIQRHVRGSEGEKDTLHLKFLAMRLWHGCSSLFFTLNPHDIRSPLTLSLCNAEHFGMKPFSLDLSDEATEAYLAALLKKNPRQLHEMAAQDPLAATRNFHYTVKMVLDKLFNCVASGKPFPDGIAGRCEPGVFGHVAGFLGVVEPQMRKALHMHMLVKLHGFSDPCELFGAGSEDTVEPSTLKAIARKLFVFLSSICFRSVEGFAEYLGEPAGRTALQQQPLIPVTAKQRGMIGEARAKASHQAAVPALGLRAWVRRCCWC